MDTQSLSGQQNQLYEFIDNLLWEEWDPIGISDVAPRDEYQAYTPELFSLAIKGAKIDEIAHNLSRIEWEMMGLASNDEKCKEIAEKIVTATKSLRIT